MVTTLRPRVTEFREDQEKHLKMILLFVPDGVDLSYNVWKVVEAKNSSSDILCNVYRGAIGTKENFLVKPFRTKINPHGTIFLTEEYSIFQSFQNDLLSEKIGLRFIVQAIE